MHWFRDTRTQLFEGTFANGRFEMSRLVKGRDSFRPMLYGQLLPTSGGTRIEIRMRLHILVLALGFVLAYIAGTIASLAAYDVVPVIGHVPVLVLVLVLGLV